MSDTTTTIRTCRCRNPKEETIDITPAGERKKRYFKRCRKCGVVTSTYSSDKDVAEKALI